MCKTDLKVLGALADARDLPVEEWHVGRAERLGQSGDLGGLVGALKSSLLDDQQLAVLLGELLALLDGPHDRPAVLIWSISGSAM